MQNQFKGDCAKSFAKFPWNNCAICYIKSYTNCENQWLEVDLNISLVYRVSQKNMGIQWRIGYRLCYELTL